MVIFAWSKVSRSFHKWKFTWKHIFSIFKSVISLMNLKHAPIYFTKKSDDTCILILNRDRYWISNSSNYFTNSINYIDDLINTTNFDLCWSLLHNFPSIHPLFLQIIRNASTPTQDTTVPSRPHPCPTQIISPHIKNKWPGISSP